METISIASFLSFLTFATLGAYSHYRKVVKSGRHFGSLWDYLVADHPARSGSVGLALIGASWIAATTGVSGFIDPIYMYGLIRDGQLPIPSIAIAYGAWQSGWQFDSQINKGGNE